MVTESASLFATIGLAKAIEFVSSATEVATVSLTVITSMARKCECISHDALSRLNREARCAAFAAMWSGVDLLLMTIADLLLLSVSVLNLLLLSVSVLNLLLLSVSDLPVTVAASTIGAVAALSLATVAGAIAAVSGAVTLAPSSVAVTLAPSTVAVTVASDTVARTIAAMSTTSVATESTMSS